MSETIKGYRSSFKYWHGIVATLIILMLTWGLLLDTLPIHGFTGWHKRVGLVTLILVILFLYQRLRQKPQSYPVCMPMWQQYVAKIVHKLIWLLILCMPLSGFWMTVFAGKYATFFSFPMRIPGIQVNMTYAHACGTVHRYAAYTLIGILSIHILAALWHRCVCQDGVWERMFKA